MDAANPNAFRIGMARTLNEVESDALQLSEDERVLLLQSISESLHESDPEIEKAWADEIRSRIADLDAGRVKTRNIDDVIAELRSGRNASAH